MPLIKTWLLNLIKRLRTEELVQQFNFYAVVGVFTNNYLAEAGLLVKTPTMAWLQIKSAQKIAGQKTNDGGLVKLCQQSSVIMK